MTDTAAERARELRRKTRERFETIGEPWRNPISRYALTEKQADDLIAAALRAAGAGAIANLNDRIGITLNNHLVEMKEGYDDSIVGFNKAWDIVRAEFQRATASPSAMAMQREVTRTMAERFNDGDIPPPAMAERTGDIAMRTPDDLAQALETIDMLTEKLSPGDQQRLRTMIAAIIRTAPTSPWREIASAPKDGTIILVASVNGGYRWVGRWSGQFGKWVCDHDGDPPADEYMPTYWQPIDPLPSPPASEASPGRAEPQEPQS